MKELLSEFIDRQKKFAEAIETSFADYFRGAPIPSFMAHAKARKDSIVALEIAAPGLNAAEVTARINMLPNSPGLYVILTSYEVADSSACRFVVAGSDLKPIYRGHSSQVRDRVMGHLMHDAYIKMCSSKKNKKPWGGYLKIVDGEGEGGLNISNGEHNAARWGVVFFGMPDSTRPLRELAENGFSGAFGTPARSQNEPNIPLSGRKGKKAEALFQA